MKKILTIDDSQFMRGLIQKSLEPLGYQVFQASNGEEGLKVMGQVHPDLITLDVEMPEMDGYQVCRTIRTTPPTHWPKYLREVPIIMVTSTDTRALREQGLEQGINDFIAKPFEPDELQRAVQHILNPSTNFKELTILLAEDSDTIRKLVTFALADLKVKVIPARDGLEALALYKAHQQDIDLVLTDLEMPHKNGLELCRDLRLIKPEEDLPIIFLTSLKQRDVVMQAFRVGASDYLTKPFVKEELLARIKIHLKNRLHQKDTERQKYAMERKFYERSKALVKTQEATIHVIASLAEHRDPETGNHTRRTQEYVHILAETLMKKPLYKGRFDLHWLEDITRSAPLHDIGKIAIEDKILLKPSKLTDEEFNAMKTHAILGEQALEEAEKHLGEENFLGLAAELAGSHHEKWDGSGYPRGLKGEGIPLTGRIMAIADVYDALVSKRVYKEGMSHEQACSIILESSGKHFDPFLVQIFSEIHEAFDQIHRRYQD